MKSLNLFITRFNSYDSAGRLESLTDPNGITTLMSYHPGGELASITRKHPSDSALDSTTLYGADATGLLTQVTQPSGQVTHYEYTEANQLKAIYNDVGERMEYELDAAGNHTKEVIKNASGEVTFSLVKGFDELSRPMNINGNHSQFTRITYDAGDNPETQTNAKQHKTQSEYDAFGRLSKVTDPAGGVTQYSYDSQGNIHTVTDARSLTTSYDFDELGRLVKLTSPDTGVSKFEYDDANNLVEKIDARNIVTQFDYDDLQRPISITYPAAPAENVSFTYDESSATNLGKGRLSSVETTGTSIGYQYNSLSLVSQKTVTIDRVGQEKLNLTNSYEYSPAGELTQIIYPSGRIVNFRHVKGQLTDITTQENSSANSQEIINGVKYLPFGPANSFIYGNGLVENRVYDSDYRLEKIHVGNFSLEYSFDSINNIEKIINNLLPTPAQSFGYDSLSRLTTASGTYGTIGWSYDSVSNRISETRNGGVTDWYAYSPTSNRLNSISRSGQEGTGRRRGAVNNGSRQFLHDAAGNRKASNSEDGSQYAYTFNHANRLASVTINNGKDVATYTYSPSGERLTKSLNGVLAEIYVWDEDSHLLQVLNSEGASVRDYIYFGEQQIAVVMNGKLLFVTNDHLGTAQIMTSSAQAVVWVANYEPFGKLAGGGVDIGSRFPGQFVDKETGIYYNYFRDYDASVGRYIESDPIGLGGGINTYSYVANQPSRYIDPRGLDNPNMGPYSLSPGEHFPNLDSAAFAATFEINALSITLNREFGGMVYRSSDGTYSFTPPRNGGADAVNPGGPRTCPPGTTAKAYYHTHGAFDANYKNEDFSPDDKNYARYFGIDGYVGTPNGDLKSFTFKNGVVNSIAKVRKN
ncbi:MAG TPA: DUF4329 domain-containing protein [Cellvibrionaceae bacterium]